ncbi:MAG TPA: FG-GAP-like repeat-containing protein [Polyangiaceae bacterium]
MGLCVLSLAAVSAAGCSADLGANDEAGTGESVGEENESLYFLSTKLWSPRNVNVCWVSSGSATEKAWVRDVMKGQRSWEHAGNINLVGWGNCASGETGIRISIGSGAATSYLARTDTGIAEMTLDFASNVSSIYSQCTDPTPDLSREDCIKTVALHEFGHALAIAHEHKRPDKPAWCTDTAGNSGNTTYGTFDLQSIMGYCADPADLSGFDRRGFDRMYGQRDGDPFKLSDINGDGRADLLCHDVTTGDKWADYASSTGQFGGTDWSIAANWCNHNTARLYKGDFNGDGRADMLCHDVANGSKWVDLANTSGQFLGTDWSTAAAWCNHDRAQLFVGDFDGNGRDDLLCHDAANGSKWVDLSNSSGQFLGTDWSSGANWCGHANGRLSVGDFNGDGRDDLLCHDRANGDKWIDFANASGQFGGTDWSLAAGWCNHDGAQLLLGDFNADGRDDLLCHDTVSGAKWTDLANSSGQFLGTDWSTAAAWCNHPTARLFVGDVNGDGRDDLLCHDATDGRKWVDLANSSGQFLGTDWSSGANWCGHDAGELH